MLSDRADAPISPDLEARPIPGGPNAPQDIDETLSFWSGFFSSKNLTGQGRESATPGAVWCGNARLLRPELRQGLLRIPLRYLEVGAERRSTRFARFLP